jgi:hypothetical protein
LACKCIPPILKDTLYDNPDSTLIAGRIIDELTATDGSYDRHFVFNVNKVFKACSIQAEDNIIVSTSFSSASCGLDLQPNTQYILSAHAMEDNLDLPTVVRVSVGSCDYNAEWPVGVSDEDKRALRLYMNTTQSHTNCNTSSSPCQTGADCDQMDEYCDVSNNQCVTIDAPCPSSPVNCYASPCTVTDPCQEAVGPLLCLDNYCGGCNAIFLDADRSQVCNS